MSLILRPRSPPVALIFLIASSTPSRLLRPNVAMAPVIDPTWPTTMSPVASAGAFCAEGGTSGFFSLQARSKTATVVFRYVAFRKLSMRPVVGEDLTPSKLIDLVHAPAPLPIADHVEWWSRHRSSMGE